MSNKERILFFPMNRVLKKGNRLIEDIRKSVDVHKIEDAQEFYMIAQNTPFAIRNVNAYFIKYTDIIIVIGNLDLATKTADSAFNYNEYRKQQQNGAKKEEKADKEYEEEQGEEEEIKEIVEEKKKEKICNYTEEDIDIVISQGEITKEEAIKLLEENEGDPLLALTKLGK